MMKTPIEPIYHSLPGWKSDISSLNSFNAIPEKMKNYILHINSYLGVNVRYISNGPGREQIILAK